MDLTVYEPGQELPAGVLAAVHGLFRASYYRYHYLSELASSDRLKVVALVQGRVSGYASASWSGTLYRLANLVVDPASRGTGLGSRLERVRYDYVRRQGASCYVSCTCEDVTSQALKLSLGLRPVALKIGYRADVVRPGERGSAVVYTDAATPVAEPEQDSTVRSTSLRRSRYVSADPQPAVLAGLPAEDYADVLTGVQGSELMATLPGFRFAGLEYDSAGARWHYCFQACNDAYREGLRQRPAVVAMPAFTDTPVRLEVTA